MVALPEWVPWLEPQVPCRCLAVLEQWVECHQWAAHLQEALAVLVLEVWVEWTRL